MLMNEVADEHNLEFDIEAQAAPASGIAAARQAEEVRQRRSPSLFASPLLHPGA